MIRRKLVYLLSLLAGLVFYWAYREWMSWIFLMVLLLLPWFSLLISLPAMLTCWAQIHCPDRVDRGAPVPLHWQCQNQYPLRGLVGKMVVQNQLTGKAYRLNSGEQLPTDHCGLLTVTLRSPRCLEYLGLFALPIRRKSSAQILVRPTPVAPLETPDLSRYQVRMWRPKPGGGYSENHELRLYRPGDSMKQVHWKLSAKTGKLITREPMEHIRTQMLLTLALNGDADSKLGRLLWMSRYLLENQLPHTVQCHTGSGMLCFDIACEEDLRRAMDAILRCPPATEGEPVYSSASWRYHIGGDAHD